MDNRITHFHNTSDLSIPSEYLTFGLSADCVIFGYQNAELYVLLIQRNAEPFLGSWALPGYLVHPGMEIDTAAKEILRDLTGLSNIFMEQFRIFDAIDRHPEARVATVGYYSLVAMDCYEPVASSWASEAKWYQVNELPQLAFDHEHILKSALNILQHKVRHQPIGFELLPEKFTLSDLQQLYEATLETRFDKPNFRKKILKMNLLEPINEFEVNVAHRPAKLYRFDAKRYNQLKDKGVVFDI